MTIAPSTDTVRVMVVLPNISGLSRDNIVNTFHFVCPVLTDTELTWIKGALQEFYNGANAGEDSISDFISSAIDREGHVTIKAYDLADPITRNAQGKVILGRPVHESQFQLGAPIGTAPVPNEVALALSYYAVRNVPRQRGRVFLGPFVQGALASYGSDSGPSPTLLGAARTAGSRLAAKTSPAGTIWGVFSDTDNQLQYPVKGGWCDNAFDTVRKRGQNPTTRFSWTESGT